MASSARSLDRKRRKLGRRAQDDSRGPQQAGYAGQAGKKLTKPALPVAILCRRL